MSRYKPVSLRHKTQAARQEDTVETLATLGLRLGAIGCWLLGVLLCVAAARMAMDIPRIGAGFPWEPAATGAYGIAALLIGVRVWAFRRWACIAAIALGAVACLIGPWRGMLFRDGTVDPGVAIATSVVSLLLFIAPLALAVYYDRARLRLGI